LGCGQVADSCRRVSEHSSSVKCEEFRHYLGAVTCSRTVLHGVSHYTCQVVGGKVGGACRIREVYET